MISMPAIPRIPKLILPIVIALPPIPRVNIMV
jgi:hypothetical protein